MHYLLSESERLEDYNWLLKGRRAAVIRPQRLHVCQALEWQKWESVGQFSKLNERALNDWKINELPREQQTSSF